MCFRLCWSDVADICWPLRRSIDGRVRPRICCPNEGGTVKDTLTTKIRCLLSVMRKFSIKSRLRIVSSSCCCFGEGPHTHPEPRCVRGQQWKRKDQQGLDCEAVKPLGFVVMPRSASFSPPKTAWTHASCPRVASAVLQVSPCSSWGSRLWWPSLFCTLVM